MSWSAFLAAHLRLSWRRRWQARRLHGRAAAAPLLAQLSAPLADRRQDWRSARYLALDLETTGGDAQRDDILSFGWVCLEGPEIRLDSARHRLVLPRRALNEASVTIHRITDDRAAAGEKLRSVLTDFLAELEDRVLIAHYTPTELGFIDAACRACFGGAFLPLVIDTLDLGRRVSAGQAPGSLRLPALRARYHLPRYAMHHALSDALAAAELFLAEAEALSARGRRTLGDLLLD
ncbi:exonuclease domain-containing protein [Accumulibacter sp.]|uniref:exonuclease domain-containing protein n=1 Tax=Accumulibacter sp. TaxID=2053492 RepID=UPI001A4D0934|nr:exonuclease domain-containing protein [Accumulibacter sp.]MBL8373021.1 3'-5' exonuclease [Accumulibacter sp.]